MEIRSVGVVGAGQMGLGIAHATARAGLDTILAKATPGGLDAQRGRLEKQLQKEVERGKLSAADHGALLERLRWTTHLHDLADVDLVIESIVEELAVKRDFFARLDDVVREQAIFATNTSTLTVGDIASATKRPERFVGLHFFNPVHAMKLVEVAPSLRTSPETVETCVAFAKRLGEAYREPRFAPPPLLRRMVLAGYLGRKSGLGFYDYQQTPPAPRDVLVQRGAR